MTEAARNVTGSFGIGRSADGLFTLNGGTINTQEQFDKRGTEPAVGSGGKLIISRPALWICILPHKPRQRDAQNC